MITKEQKKEYYELILKQVKSKTEGGDYKAIDKEVEEKRKKIKLARHPEIESEIAEKLYKEPYFFAGLGAIGIMATINKDRARVLADDLEKKTRERVGSLLVKGLRKYHNL